MFRAALIGLLVAFQVLPPHVALAQQHHPITQSVNVRKPLDPEALLKFAAAQAENGAHPDLGPVLTRDAAHLGLLIGQELVQHKTDGTEMERWDFDSEDVSLPAQSMSDGVMERDALVRATEHGFELSHKGLLYGRSFVLPPGERYINFVADNDFIRILTQSKDSARIYAISVADLRAVFFSNKIPVARVAVIPVRADEDPKSEIRLVQITRRSSNQDQSLAAREGSLDFRTAWRRYIIGTASRESVARMKQNLALIPELPFDPAQILASGDDVLIRIKDGQSELLTPPLMRDAIYRAIDQTAAVVEAGKVIANQELELALSRRKKYTDEQESIINEVLHSPESLMSFFLSGQFANMQSIDDEYVGAMQGAARDGQSTDSSRDRYTAADRSRAIAHFNETIEAAQEAMRHHSRVVPRIARSVVHAFENSVGPFERQRMRYLTSYLKTTALIGGVGNAAYAAVDLMSSGDANRFAIQFLAGSWDWATQQMPVLALPGYPTLMGLSAVAQYIPIVLIFVTAALAAPFTQFNASQLIVNKGIQWYATYLLQSPLRWAAKLTRFAGGESWIAALAKGKLFGPMTDVAAEERASQAIKADSIKLSVAKAVALQVVAKRRHLDPGAILREMEDPEANANGLQAFEESREISEALRNQLIKRSTTDMNAVLKGDREATLQLIHEAHAAADRLIDKQDPETKARWWDYFTIVAKSRILSAIATFQSKTADRLRNARASIFVVSTVISAFLVDFSISLGAMLLTGAMADPTRPDNLHAVDNYAIGFTNVIATGENIRQTPAHIGAGAADSHLQFSKASQQANAQHRSAAIVDDEEKVVRRLLPLHRELYRYLRTTLDIRELDIPEKAARRMRISFSLLNASLLMNIPIRTLIMGQGLQEALIGHLDVMFLGFFAFAHPWYLYYSVKHRHESAIENNLAAFERSRIELKRAMDLRDNETAAIKIEELRQHYVRADFRYDLPDFENAEQAYEFALANPAFTHRARQWINVTALTGVAISTTYLLSYLFMDSVKGLETSLTAFNLDPQSFNLFRGLPQGDGPISVAAKSIGLMWSLVVGKKIFNIAYDTVALMILRKTDASDAAISERSEKRNLEIDALKAANPIAWARRTAQSVTRFFVGPKRVDLEALRCAEAFRTEE